MNKRIFKFTGSSKFDIILIDVSYHFDFIALFSYFSYN